MKKLLCLLTSISLITGTVAPIAINISSNYTTNSENEDEKEYTVNSFANLIKIINLQWNSKEVIENSKEADLIINSEISTYYSAAFNEKEGTMHSWSLKPIDNDQTIWNFTHSFKNDSPYEQTYNTWEYSKTISNSHDFSMTLTEKNAEKISFGGKITIPYLNTEVGTDKTVEFEFTNEKNWSTTETETITVTAPSQSIQASAHSTLNVSYSIIQGTYASEGIVNFEVKDLDEELFHMPHLNFNEDGSYKNVTWEYFSVAQLIDILKKFGYSEELKNNYTQYSIITMDDIEEPQQVYLNLPLSWRSQGGKIEVSHYEESLK